jgi:hypothetical protein
VEVEDVDKGEWQRQVVVRGYNGARDAEGRAAYLLGEAQKEEQSEKSEIHMK